MLLQPHCGASLIKLPLGPSNEHLGQEKLGKNGDSFSRSVSNTEVAEFVAAKQPGSVSEAQAVVAKLTAAPLAKRCWVCYMGNEDYGNWLRGTVNGRPVSFMLSQNSDSFVSVNAVNRLGPTTTLCRPFCVKFLGWNPSPPHNRKVRKLKFQLEGGYKGCMDFSVMDLIHHDFVLGHQLLKVCSEAIYKDDDGIIKVDFGLGGGQKFTSPFHQGRPQFEDWPAHPLNSHVRDGIKLQAPRRIPMPVHDIGYSFSRGRGRGPLLEVSYLLAVTTLVIVVQSVPNAEVAEFVAGKQPGSLNEAQDLVAELTAAPLAKTCLVSFVGDDDYGRWLRGTVNGRPASFMLSQNSDSFVSVNAVNRLGLTTSLCHPFSVNLLVGSTAQPSNRKVADLEFELEGGFKGCLDFAVMNLARHDFVLGHELINLCSEYVLSFRDGMKIELECGGQSFTSRFQQGRPQF
ncbi:hypothetical protein SELMODRAFT_404732 [Selaginella moellendorffii]|uniref:Uncharacterized protein n=1 Tax=Selaginella moellendorffii TaxID=88036 RepID=D8QW79_SELML|nr:hypothetical protein SELMODRAFT_404732 [Selaginella moellendorffii]